VAELARQSNTGSYRTSNNCEADPLLGSAPKNGLNEHSKISEGRARANKVELVGRKGIVVEAPLSGTPDDDARAPAGMILQEENSKPSRARK